MAPITDRSRPEPTDLFDPLAATQQLSDVPGLMADRIGALYADEERRDRKERTERLIREAEERQ